MCDRQHIIAQRCGFILVSIVSRRRTLIVNNNQQESDALVQLFDSFGHEASAMWSGRDALDYLATNRIDLLLVDQFLADMYVGKFIERVLSQPNHPRVTITKGAGNCKSIKYDKSLGECQVFEKEQPDEMYQILLMAFPELSDGPVN
jgi:CheY-like chemotaxis protein